MSRCQGTDRDEPGTCGATTKQLSCVSAHFQLAIAKDSNAL
jgi:hypothetical protein